MKTRSILSLVPLTLLAACATTGDDALRSADWDLGYQRTYAETCKGSSVTAQRGDYDFGYQLANAKECRAISASANRADFERDYQIAYAHACSADAPCETCIVSCRK